MPRSEAERNLLFGLLAVQTGLIDRAALVNAFRRPGAGEKSLTDILGDRGALDAEGKALIQALAAKHLVAHGGDLEKSLGSLAAAGSTREILTQLGDPTADRQPVASRSGLDGRRSDGRPDHPARWSRREAGGSGRCVRMPRGAWGRCSWHSTPS